MHLVCQARRELNKFIDKRLHVRCYFCFRHSGVFPSISHKNGPAAYGLHLASVGMDNLF